ncbi:MAG: hypothetical protein QOI95_1090 [Acidimicrobiaceae bacterium]|jgi:hypothetical protein
MDASRTIRTQDSGSARVRLSLWLAQADELLAELDREDQVQRLRVRRAREARSAGLR